MTSSPPKLTDILNPVERRSAPGVMQSVVEIAATLLADEAFKTYTVETPGDDIVSVTRDGLTVFFASSRPGGSGGLDIWLAAQDGKAPWKNIGEFIAWQEVNKELGTMKYGVDALVDARDTDLEKGKAKYEMDQKRALDIGGTNGIDAAIKNNKLDAIIYMGSRGASIGDRVGYPAITVPFAMVANPGPALPEGFDAKPMPMGIMFQGLACTEPRLIELAYSFEQATKKRQPPPNMP